jgi:hypothetical protein
METKLTSRSVFELTPILSEIAGVLQKTFGRKELKKEYHKYLEEKYLSQQKKISLPTNCPY